MKNTRRNLHSQDTSIAACIQGVDYVELYVSNALQAAQYYRTTFGFMPIAYASLETGLRDRASYVLRQEESTLVVTSALSFDSPIADYVRRHGDGVKDVALRVSDVAKVFAIAMKRGAQTLLNPTLFEDNKGRVIKATIRAPGDMVHSFVQRDEFTGVFWPAYQEIKPRPTPWTGLHQYDHIALSLPKGDLQRWVNFYIHVLEFHQLHKESIQTEYSAMNSIVVHDDTDKIKFALTEPISDQHQSQVEEYLKYNEGPGVQHIALHTNDIIKTVRALQKNGVDFVPAPRSYYDMLPGRIDSIQEDLQALRKLNILADQDKWGYLLQIFSRPVQPRPTLFIEIIQRHNARGFGNSNIQVLEHEQARRSNL